MTEKMSELALLAFLREEQANAYHHLTGRIAEDRVQSLKDYMREPYGNEEDGRSSAISSDVFDMVEGMLPDLLEVFVSTDKAVVFEPVGPDDEESAKQATQACNHVFYKQNNGFLVLYEAIKDALMLKTGAIRWWWDESREVSFQSYTADEMQLAVHLTTHPDVQVVEQDELPADPKEAEQYAMQGMPQPRRFRVKLKTISKKSKVCIASVPPDELHISARHDSLLLDKCPYVAHVSERTLSELVDMGLDVTEDDLRGARDNETTQDREYRDAINGSDRNWRVDNSHDDSMRRAWLRDEYVLVDFDGDGIAERRRILRIGEKVFENQEVSHVPFAAWTPYLIPHQFHGLSPADLISDTQRIGTDILRNQLDNLAMANNQETVVLTDSQGSPKANLDDLLNRRVGGIMRESVAGAIRPYTERWQGIEAMPMVEMLQQMKENRTGYTRYSQGLDGDSLNKTATGVTKIMNASQKRQKLMGRICAEALLAPTFRGIFKTLTDYCMEKLSFRLNGKFVQFDPQEWRDQYDMTINVGIGQGDELQQAQMLQQIAAAQMAYLPTPLGGRVVTEANVFAVQARIAENAGFKNPAEFWTDPSQLGPPQPPAPDPKIALEQAKLQASTQEAAAKRQDDAHRFQAETQQQMAIDQNRQEWEARQKQMELQQQAQLASVQAQYAAQADAQRIAFDRWKVEFEANVKMAIAEKQSQDKKEHAMFGAQSKQSDMHLNHQMAKDTNA